MCVDYRVCFKHLTIFNEKVQTTMTHVMLLPDSTAYNPLLFCMALTLNSVRIPVRALCYFSPPAIRIWLIMADVRNMKR